MILGDWGIYIHHHYIFSWILSSIFHPYFSIIAEEPPHRWGFWQAEKGKRYFYLLPFFLCQFQWNHLVWLFVRKALKHRWPSVDQINPPECLFDLLRLRPPNLQILQFRYGNIEFFYKSFWEPPTMPVVPFLQWRTAQSQCSGRLFCSSRCVISFDRRRVTKRFLGLRDLRIEEVSIIRAASMDIVKSFIKHAFSTI